MGFLVTALVCTALMPGCPQATPKRAAPLPPAGQVELLYGRRGGLHATVDQLSVFPGRHAAAEEEGPAGSREKLFRMGVPTIRRLQRGLAAAHFRSLHSPRPGKCADCYEYDLEYEGHLVAFDDSTFPDSLRPVVSQLQGLIAKHAAEPEG